MTRNGEFSNYGFILKLKILLLQNNDIRENKTQLLDIKSNLQWLEYF